MKHQVLRSAMSDLRILFDSRNEITTNHFFPLKEAAIKFFLIKTAFCPITSLRAMKNLVVGNVSHTPYTVIGKSAFPILQHRRCIKWHTSMKAWVGPKALAQVPGLSLARSVVEPAKERVKSPHFPCGRH